jgi:hypothetical protein
MHHDLGYFDLEQKTLKPLERLLPCDSASSEKHIFQALGFSSFRRRTKDIMALPKELGVDSPLIIHRVSGKQFIRDRGIDRIRV